MPDFVLVTHTHTGIEIVADYCGIAGRTDRYDRFDVFEASIRILEVAH
jgi:hypothetical protein